MPAIPSHRYRIAALTLPMLGLAACSLLDQTPDPERRTTIRTAVPYGMTMAAAESKLSGLGFACSKRGGNYLDESGATRSTEHFLQCEERPNTISFACENRDQVTVIDRDGAVSGIEVTRGPSCQPASSPALQIK